ncbi:hypothetical protein Prudu_012167, partial [Prunus dulcis]
SHKCPPASAWRVVACRRCKLSVGLSSCNWASFVDLDSGVEELERVCDSLYAIDDVDIEMLCPDSPPMEGGIEEQVTEAEVDAVDEMMADVMVQADGVAEGVASQVDAKRLQLKGLLLASPEICEYQGPLEDSGYVLHIPYVISLRKMTSTRVPLRDSGCVLHISYVISLRKLASTRVPLERLRLASTRVPLERLRLASTRVPLEGLREAWRPPFKKFLAHPASPLGRFLVGCVSKQTLLVVTLRLP